MLRVNSDCASLVSEEKRASTYTAGRPTSQWPIALWNMARVSDFSTKRPAARQRVSNANSEPKLF